MQFRWDEIESILSAARVAYLYGPPGVGKTFVARKVLSRRSERVYSITLSEDVVLQELLGTWIPGPNEWRFQVGPMVNALHHGALIINEVHRASWSVKDALLAILDSHSSAELVLPTNSVVRPHADFAAVLTANVGPDELDPALVDRFDVVIRVDQPHPDSIDRIRKLLGDRWAKAVEDSWRDPDRGISIRKTLAFARLARVMSHDLAGAAVWGVDQYEEILRAIDAAEA